MDCATRSTRGGSSDRGRGHARPLAYVLMMAPAFIDSSGAEGLGIVSVVGERLTRPETKFINRWT
jgi:hypothetical protein